MFGQRIKETSPPPFEVSFQTNGYAVTVYGDGSIVFVPVEG